MYELSKRQSLPAVRSVLWALALGLLVVLAVPWFMWRSGTVVYGLPVWLWWHVGWMLGGAVVFGVFSRYAWGVWVES